MQKKTTSMTALPTENQEIIPLLLPEKAIEVPGVQFFFTTRRGGGSQGAYASLNLGDHVGDDPRLVARNRARLESLWAGRITKMCYLNQVHGTTTVAAEAGPLAPPPEADAWVTRHPGIALAILTADCAPVLFADGTARVIGAAHAGWRGGLAGVLESCLDAMLHLGARREQITALVGPSIQHASYAVDEAFQATFARHEDKISPGYKKFFSKQNYAGKLLFDLPGYLRGRLALYGLLKERIHDARQCTYLEKNEFFSHRRSTQQGVAPCGRQVGGVFLA